MALPLPIPNNDEPLRADFSFVEAIQDPQVEKKVFDTLYKGIGNPNVKYSDQLKACKMILDRNPKTPNLKQVNIEHTGSVTVVYNSHLQRLATEQKGLPPPNSVQSEEIQDVEITKIEEVVENTDGVSGELSTRTDTGDPTATTSNG